MNMLKSIREKKGLSVGQLAARSSIPSRILIEYEEGRQPIPLPHAKLIAKALWVQIEDLMPPGSVGAPTPAPQPQNPAHMAAPTQTQPRPAQPAPTPTHTSPAPPPPPRPSGPPREMYAARDAASAPTIQRPPRPADADAPGVRPVQGGPPIRRGGPDARPTRPPRLPSAPPKPLSEGQLVELLRLSARMEIEQAQFEEKIGKPVSQLTRTEAKDWIKRLRLMADEIAPSGRVRFGQWPGTKEDQEAAYLATQREAGTPFEFKLFNGESYSGKIVDYTPYTITIDTNGGQEMVLRKLAIMYYRQSQGDAARASQANSAHPHEHPGDDLGSDRVGEPGAPERDNMDEDRGV